MDPNEALSAIRNALRSLDRIDPDDLDTQSLISEVEYLREHVIALDEWMSKGGSLPLSWDR